MHWHPNGRSAAQLPLAYVAGGLIRWPAVSSERSCRVVAHPVRTAKLGRYSRPTAVHALYAGGTRAARRDGSCASLLSGRLRERAGNGRRKRFALEAMLGAATVAGGAATASVASSALLSPFVLVCISLCIAFLLSAALGANDVANALGTSVGTGAVSVTKALAIGAVCEFAGAVLFGSTVTRTISAGVVTLSGAALAAPSLYMLGMLSVLVGCTLWLGLATRYGLPVSSTHSVVGSLIGLGMISGWAIQWEAVLRILLSWLISPVMGGLVAWLLFRFIRQTIIDAPRPTRAMRRWLPILCGSMLFILTLFLQLESEHSSGWTLFQAVASSFGVAALGAGMSGAMTSFIHSKQFVRKTVPPPSVNGNGRKLDASEAAAVALAALAALQADEKDVAEDELGADTHWSEDVQLLPTCEYIPTTMDIVMSSTSLSLTTYARKRQHDIIEQVFSILQLLTACFVSFSHGSNDVSNAIGPFASILAVYRNGSSATMMEQVVVPPWALVFGGLGISFGLGVWGRPVMDTVGKKITHLVPTRGFCVELSTALTVLMATQIGMPVSTTHTLIGSIVAMGLATGHGSVNRRVLLNILLSWFVTVPVSAALTALCFLSLRGFV
jgi:PiT family inorganic phosphate transporter